MARRSVLAIAIVAPRGMPIGDAAATGEERSIADLARGLATRGHDVTLYAAPGSRLDGVDVVAIERPAAGDAFARTYAAIRARGCDVISQHALATDAIAGASFWPAVHTLHAPPLIPELVAALARAPGALVAPSGATGSAWRRALRRGVHVIVHGIAGEPPVAAPAADYALIAGPISRERGTSVALRAARASGLRVQIAGEIHDAVYFEHEVAPLLADAVMLGRLARDELWQVMSRAAVVVMPIAWDEPLGRIAAEAQLAGCPVAAYHRGALGEIVQDGIGGFLAPAGEFAQLLRAIGRCLDLDRAEVQRAARSRFAVEPCIAAYESVLAEQVAAYR